MGVPNWLASDPIERGSSTRVRPGWVPRPNGNVKLIKAWEVPPEMGAGADDEMFLNPATGDYEPLKKTAPVLSAADYDVPAPPVEAAAATTQPAEPGAEPTSAPATKVASAPAPNLTAGSAAATVSPESSASTEAPSIDHEAGGVLSQPSGQTAARTGVAKSAAPTAPPQGPSSAAAPSAASSASGIAGTSTRSAPPSSMTSFVQQNEATAMQIEKETGIPHQLLLAIPGNETGWGSAVAGNNYFGIKGSNPNTGANTGPVATTEVVNGKSVGINDTFRAYSGYEESARDFASFLQDNSRYKSAMDYLKTQPNDWRGFIRMVHDAGYATDPQWSNKIISIGNDVDGVDVSGNNTPLGSSSGSKGTQSVVTHGVNQVGTRPVMQTSMSTSQFGDPQLSSAEAYSACGPAAAVRFAQAYGRNPTLREATDLARGVGWTAGSGMAGIGSEQKLLTQMGVDTQMISGAKWDQFAQLAQTGSPITISTPGHYFYADDYNAKDGTFHVGQSGLDLKHGSEWMTPGQMESLMGGAQGALYSTNPVSAQGGGTTSDCAPALAWMYQEATGLRVPGDMKLMYGATQSVKTNNAAPGDLVFYGMGGDDENSQHAGIYLGNGLMLHDNSANPNGGVDVIPLWDGAEFRRVPGVDPMLGSYSNSGKPAQPQSQPNEQMGDWMVTSHGGRQLLTATLSSGRLITQDMGATDAPTGSLLSSGSQPVQTTAAPNAAAAAAAPAQSAAAPARPATSAAASTAAADNPAPQINQMLLDPSKYGYGDKTPRNGLPVNYIVNHVAAGNGSLANLYKNQEENTHYWVGKDGRIEQYVPDDQASYGAGKIGKSTNLPKDFPGNGQDYNRESINIEREGMSNEMPTAAQWDSLVKLNTYLAQKYNLPMDNDHVVGHYRTDEGTRGSDPYVHPQEYMDKLLGDMNKSSAATKKPKVGAGQDDDGDEDETDYSFLDTPLSPAGEGAFQAWKSKYAPRDSGWDYDLRGAYAAGLKPDPESGHWPDTYKKPNHPTFSDQSKFAKDYPDRAGHWDGDQYTKPSFLNPSTGDYTPLQSGMGAGADGDGTDGQMFLNPATGNYEPVRRVIPGLAVDQTQTTPQEVVQDVGQNVGQAASNVGSTTSGAAGAVTDTAQDAATKFQQSKDAGTLGDDLTRGASETAGGIFSGLGGRARDVADTAGGAAAAAPQKAADVGEAVQTANQATPGKSAVEAAQAAAPEAAKSVSDLDSAIRNVSDTATSAPVEATKAIAGGGAAAGAALATPEGRDELGTTARAAADYVASPEGQEKIDTANRIVGVANPQTAAQTIAPGVQASTSYLLANGIDTTPLQQQFQQDIQPDAGSLTEKVDEGHRLGVGEVPQFVWETTTKAMDTLYNTRVQAVRAAQAPEIRDTPEGGALQHGLAIASDPTMYLGMGSEVARGAKVLDDAVETAEAAQAASDAARVGNAATLKGAVGRFLGEELGAAGTPGDVEAARAAQRGIATPAMMADVHEPGVGARAVSEQIADEAARNPMSPDSPVAIALDRPYAKDEEAHLLQQAALNLNDDVAAPKLMDASHALDGTAKHEPMTGEQLRRVIINAVAEAHPEYAADDVLAHTDQILHDSGMPLLSHGAQIAAGRDIPDSVFFARNPWWSSTGAQAAAQAANTAARTGDMSGLPNLAKVAADGAGAVKDAAAAAMEAGVTRTPNVLKRIGLSAGLGAAGGGSELAYGDPNDPNHYRNALLKAGGGALVGALAPYASAFIDKSITSHVLEYGKKVFAPAENLSASARAPFTDWANNSRVAKDAGARLEDQWRSVFGDAADGKLAAYIERTGQLPAEWAKTPGAQEALDKWKSVADWAKKYDIVDDPRNFDQTSRAQMYVPHVLEKDWDIALKDVGNTDKTGPGRFNANPFNSYNKSREFETLQDGIDAGTQYAQDLPSILGNYYTRAMQSANNQGLIERWAALAEKNRVNQYPLAEIANKLLAGEDVVKATGKDIPLGYKNISNIPGFGHIAALENTVISPDLYNVMHNATNTESGLAFARPLQDMASVFKHNTLQGSAFHALNEVRQIFATNGAEAPRTLFKIITQNTTEGGYRAFMEANRPIVDQAIKDGLTLNVVPDRMDNLNAAQRWGLAAANMAGGSVAGYQTALNAGEDNGDALKQAAFFGALGGALGAPVFKLGGLSDESRSLVEHFSHAMWDRWIPSAKLMTYQMYAPQYGGQAAASFVNSVFGGQNLLAIARSKTVQDAMSLALLAPDWQEGWARLAGNALFSWGKDAPLGDMARNYWGNALVQHAVTLEGMNLALGGGWSWQNDPDATLMVKANNVYDMMGWNRTDQKTGQKYDAYWDILGPYRGMMEPMQQAARASTAAAYQASGYDLSKLPLHDEVMGKWGSVPPSNPGDAIKSFIGSRSGLIPSTFGEVLAQTDFANRPIDQADDSDAQRALNRVWQVTSHMVPTYLSEGVRDSARGDPAPIALWSAATGMRARREDETTRFFDQQDQFVKENQKTAQQWADLRADSRATSTATDTKIQALESGQVKNADGSDMTAVQRTNQIADLGNGRPTQRKDLQKLIDNRQLPDGPAKDELQRQLQSLLSMDITAGSPDQPADLKPQDAPNSDELYRLAWNRDPNEVDRYKGTSPQPEGAAGLLDQARRAIQNPPGGSDDKALQTLRARWLQQTAQTWGVDPAVLQDLVKSKSYQEDLPQLQGVSSGQLDDITDGYRKAGLDNDGKAIPDAAMAAGLKQQYIMDTAQQLGIDPQALNQRVKLRQLPMGDPTPDSISRSHALDVLSSSRYYKYQNPDGTPMGTPKDWQDWDKQLSDNKDRFHFTSRGGQGFFFKDGQPDQKLDDLYTAQQQGQANRYKQVYTSPNRDDYYRWFGDGANLTDKQWQQYSNGTLDMWHDSPSQKEALNRVQAMRLWAGLTPQQQNSYANGDGRAPIKWQAQSIGGQGSEPRATSLAAYMAYIRTYRNKDYDLGDIDQKPPEPVSSAGG